MGAKAQNIARNIIAIICFLLNSRLELTFFLRILNDCTNDTALHKNITAVITCGSIRLLAGEILHTSNCNTDVINNITIPIAKLSLLKTFSPLPFKVLTSLFDFYTSLYLASYIIADFYGFTIKLSAFYNSFCVIQ